MNLSEEEENGIEQRAREYLGPKQAGIPWDDYYVALAKMIKVTRVHRRIALRVHAMQDVPDDIPPNRKMYARSKGGDVPMP